MFSYIEQGQIYDDIDFTGTWIWVDQNKLATGVSIPTLLCPSDGLGGPYYEIPEFDQKYPRTNYFGMFDGYEIGDLRSTDAEKRAFFTVNNGNKVQDISDGTSHTICLAEGLTGAKDDARGFAWSDQPAGSQIYSELGPNSSLPDRCYPSSVWCKNMPELNRPSVQGDGNTTDTCAARSMHPGGVQVLMGDGSTHFVNEDIELAVWRALATIAGGESIEAGAW